MICPKCGSQNVESQIVTGDILEEEKKRGILWWIFIGWWWTLIKLFLFGIWYVAYWILKKIFKKPKKSGMFTQGAHMCKDCGYTWTTKAE